MVFFRYIYDRLKNTTWYLPTSFRTLVRLYSKWNHYVRHKEWSRVSMYTTHTTSVNFLPREKKIEPETIFNIVPEKFSKCPRKFFENSPRKKVPEKKTAKLNPRKKYLCPKKKSIFSPSKSKKYLEILRILPEKKILNPIKNLKICPRKLQNARENLGKSGREIYFPPEKKTEKRAKKWFLGHFSFCRV